MSALTATRRGRVLAERLMVDTCTVSRASGEPVFNSSTGQYDTPSSPVYSGKCKVQSRGNQAKNPEAGEVQFTVASLQVHVPAGSDVRDGDLITVTASVLAPVLVGRVFRVDGFIPDSFDTAYRVPVEVHT